jgi:hypothetical protein
MATTSLNFLARKNVMHLTSDPCSWPAPCIFHIEASSLGFAGENHMEQIVECLIAGGPQHGLVRRQLWDPDCPAPPVLASVDGELCTAAACRPAGPCNNRFLLLHPHATGSEIISMMAVLNGQACSAYISVKH